MFTDSFKISSEPVNRLNKLMMETYSGIVDAQMSSLRGYMGLVEDQAKAAATIRDFDGVKGFVEAQPERFNQLVERMSEDLQQFAKVAEDFRNEASQLFQSTVAESAEAADQPAASAKPATATQKKAAASNS
ncbi:phasin family protein [Marinobacter zhejiangensis]|uniref:Phasin family protein n=1 Tax=Marinobacter zhejiangensis TaxID=488535 RepID=A0A1I4NUW6_9GAMM|nr:phasin family protein [Marinobacter zhejiangensis]SFM18923.1 phasin family protein [Marinobacter zhejiangensis]